MSTVLSRRAVGERRLARRRHQAVDGVDRHRHGLQRGAALRLRQDARKGPARRSTRWPCRCTCPTPQPRRWVWNARPRPGSITPVSACASGSEAIAHAWRRSCSARPTSRSAVASRPRSRRCRSRGSPRCASCCRPPTTTRRAPAARSTRTATVSCSARRGALMVIETEEHAKARGANILARLMGASVTSDGYHIVAPDPNGEQAGHAITRAIQLAGLTPADIDHVNAHATGTSVGDVAEGKAINNALGSMAATPAVYAPKSRARPLRRRGRRGGVDPDRAWRCGTGRPADPEPEEPRSRDRPGRGGGRTADRQLSSTRSTIRSDSAGTTSRSPLADTDPGSTNSE